MRLVLMDSEEVALRRALLELSSRAASLHFKLVMLLEEARIETIRLSGFLSSCETLNGKEHPLRKEVEELIAKYVITSEKVKS
ncbi:MAG: hypothetical protein QW732_08225 [Zestosphaera sp.]